MRLWPLLEECHLHRGSDRGEDFSTRDRCLTATARRWSHFPSCSRGTSTTRCRGTRWMMRATTKSQTQDSTIRWHTPHDPKIQFCLVSILHLMTDVRMCSTVDGQRRPQDQRGGGGRHREEPRKGDFRRMAPGWFRTSHPFLPVPE
jgi:hypothetical protein